MPQPAAEQPEPDRTQLEQLIQRMNEGEVGARDEFVAQVYGTLRALAGAAMRGARGQHTLQPTALVSEAWFKLFRDDQCQWNDEDHFFRVAAMAMRCILVDHARRKAAAKRSARRVQIDIDSLFSQFDDQSWGSVLDLEEALIELERLEPRLAEMVTLRFYGGLTIEEASARLGLEGTRGIVDWRAAKAWLRKRLAS